MKYKVGRFTKAEWTFKKGEQIKDNRKFMKSWRYRNEMNS